MKSRWTTAVSAHKLWAVLVIFAGLLLLLTMMLTQSSAQSPEERVLEDLIPKHVPIKVKIKKEKEDSFKDLKNDLWVRDFELEVTNTGEKPIYYLYLMLLLPEMKVFPGYDDMIPLSFGKTELGDIKIRAQPEDIAIGPGDTYVLKIHPGVVSAWKNNARVDWPQLPKIQIQFQYLSFGDRSGYGGSEGHAVPHAPFKQ